jgi:hypothetical protein
MLRSTLAMLVGAEAAAKDERRRREQSLSLANLSARSWQA